MKKEKIKEWLVEQIKDLTDEDGCYRIYPCGYDDIIGEDRMLKMINEYLKGETGYEFFEDYASSQFWEWNMDADDYLFTEIDRRANAEDYDEDADTEFAYEFEEYIEDLGGYNEAFEDAGYNGISFDLTEFMGDYKINLILGSDEEMRYDFGSITRYFAEKTAEDASATERFKNNALSYLIEQCGYDVRTVLRYALKYYNDAKSIKNIQDKFLYSVVEELGDTLPDYNIALTFLIRITGKNLFNLINAIKNKKDSIKFSPNTTLGLYDHYQGTGSQLGIELDRDVIFPASFIRVLQLEGAGRKQNKGCTIDSSYGLIGSVWKPDCCTIIKNDP